jgi:hypothetical protein
MSLTKPGTNRELSQCQVENAIEVPELHQKMAILEEELEIMEEVEDENMALRI